MSRNAPPSGTLRDIQKTAAREGDYCLVGLTRLLLKSKDPKSIDNARQRVAGDNVYFKASQSVLARVFLITCLFAREDVCYEFAVIPMKYYIKLHGS